MSTRTNASVLELENRPTQSMNQSTPSTLAPLPPHPSSLDVSDNFRAVEQYLQPADGGPAAWRLLGAALKFSSCRTKKTKLKTYL